MAEIGIMSMQRIYNYGSSLQGYALRRLLETASGGAAVEFLDFKPGRTLTGEPLDRFRRAMAKVLGYGAVDAKLRDKVRFFNHKRKYGSCYHGMIGVQARPNHTTDVALQVIGSDEVFNCVQSNENVGFAKDLFGLGSDARFLASYAASFGNTTLEKIEEVGIRDELAQGLTGFSAISVRDDNSANIVAELLGTDAPSVHLDPTLVFGLMEDPRIPTSRLCGDKYLIVYGYSGRFNRVENRAIRSIAKKQGLRVLAFGGLQESADEYIDCNPFELLAYFRDAEAIVTDTFHGSIFSIINEVPFATFVRSSNEDGYGNEEKLGYLLRRLGLNNKAVTDALNLEAHLYSDADFEAVRAIRAEETSRTQSYLKSICQEAGLGSTQP